MEMEISHSQFVKDYYKLKRNKYINPNSWGGYLPKSWFNDVFFNLSFEVILLILKGWRKNPPSFEVLENFKDCLNYKTMGENYFNRIITFRNHKNREIIYHLIYFGLECDQNILDAVDEISKKIERLEEDKLFLEKIKAGKMIAEYIEDAMDDEFEMKPLRAKIDLGNIKRLMEDYKF
jgi:hypothetical protein